MRKLKLSAAAAAAALALGACGEDDDEAPATVTDTRTVVETQTVTGPSGPEETPQVGPTPGDGAGQGPGATRRECGQVAFQPNSDAGAFEIRSVGVPCERARQVARAAKDVQDLSYEARGFSCDGRRRDTELPSVAWSCAAGASERVTFETS